MSERRDLATGDPFTCESGEVQSGSSMGKNALMGPLIRGLRHSSRRLQTGLTIVAEAGVLSPHTPENKSHGNTEMITVEVLTGSCFSSPVACK